MRCHASRSPDNRVTHGTVTELSPCSPAGIERRHLAVLRYAHVMEWYRLVPADTLRRVVYAGMEQYGSDHTGDFFKGHNRHALA